VEKHDVISVINTNSEKKDKILFILLGLVMIGKQIVAAIVYKINDFL
jgi:hypothetical protein